MENLVAGTWNLKPIQDSALEIFKAFAAICEKHNLRYYAAYGTALGAVRHQGFIPWDDDFDVIMPRPDFMRLFEVAGDELPSYLSLRRGGEQAFSPIYYAKLCNTKEGLKASLSKKSGLPIEHNPFIDIFVLDGFPDDLSDVKHWRRVRRMLRLCQVYRHPECIQDRHGWLRFKSNIARIGGALLSHRYRNTIDNRDMMRLMDEEYSRWAYESSKSVVEYCFFRNRSSRIFPKELYGEGRLVPFCDTVIRVPSHVEVILRHYYGDYMKFPPEKDRKPPHILKLMYEGHV